MTFNQDNSTKIAIFKEATAVTDEDICCKYLKTFGWRLEDAILAYSTGFRVIESTSESSDDENDESNSSAYTITPEATPLQVNSSSIVRYCWLYIYAIFMYPFNLIGTIICKLKEYMSTRNDYHDSPPYLFLKTILEKTPLFQIVFDGELEDAIEECYKTKKNLICVSYQDRKKFNQRNIRRLLLNESNQILIKTHFLLYGVFSFDREDILLLSNSPTPYYPFFEVIVIQDGKTDLHSYIGDLKDIKQFNNFLRNLVDIRHASSQNPVINRKVRSLDFTSNLVQSQNEEYNKSLSMDRERQKLIEEQQIEEENKLKTIKEREDRIARINNAFQQFRVKHTSDVTYEDTASKNISLKLKYPDGLSTTIKPSTQTSLTTLYQNIIYGNENLDCNFHVYTCQPRSKICTFHIGSKQDERTLKEVGLDSSQVLMVEYISDEEP